MRVLFLHQNYPGQFLRLAAALARDPVFDVAGLGDGNNRSERGRPFAYPVFAYKARPAGKSGAHHYLSSFEAAIRRGQDVLRSLQQIRRNGFVPDLVFGHPGWGEMLFVRDVFPAARQIAYFEYFYRADGGDLGFDPEYPLHADIRYKLRIRNSTQLHALAECDAGVSPTEWQRSTYPSQEQPRIRVIHEGINHEQARPDADAVFVLADGRKLTRADTVITYVSRKLEPYRGFHVFMRALPELQRRLPRAQFVIVGADGVSYGRPAPAPHKTYRDMLLAEVGGELDMARTHFAGHQPYAGFLSLLQISRLHVYLTYPFVLSWSMLEAMACGAPLLASSTAPVREVIRDGENGYLFGFFDRQQLVDRAVSIIGQPDERTAAIRKAARHEIESRYTFTAQSLPAYRQLIEDVMS